MQSTIAVVHITKTAPSGLTAEGVRVTYPNGSPALRGVDLTIEPGQVVVLLGAPGSGRSTLLRCLAGLRRPDSGTVRCNGVDLARLRGRALRRHLAAAGVVFQEFAQGDGDVLRSTVLTGRPPVVGALARGSAVDATVRAGLIGRLQQRARRGAGDAMLATILRADRLETRVEGTSATGLIDDVARLARSVELSAVLTVPDVTTALRVADRVVGMRAGRVVWDLPATLVDDRDVRELYG